MVLGAAAVAAAKTAALANSVQPLVVAVTPAVSSAAATIAAVGTVFRRSHLDQV